MIDTTPPSVSLFDDGPVIDLDLDFTKFSERAALNSLDQEAFAGISATIERARDSGDLARVYQMAMTIGAMACLHDHMQGLASDINDSIFGKSDFDAVNHFGESSGLLKDSHTDEDDDDDEDDNWGRKKKKR